jgi:hypothetical protein
MSDYVQIGNPSLRLVAVERSFDPTAGPQTQFVYEGLEDACNVFAAQMASAGARARVQPQAGPVHRVHVQWPEAMDGAAEIPEFRWSIGTEFIQADLRSNPKLIEAAGDAFTLGIWVATINDWLKDRTKNALPAICQNADAQALYELMARGAEAYEIRRITLRRRRVVPLSWADYLASDVAAIDRIYTTADLVNKFAVPTVVREALPATPDIVPPNCTWGWKERVNETDFLLSQNRREQSNDWVFAAWSLLLYDLFEP